MVIPPQTRERSDVSNITAGDEQVRMNRAFLFQSPTVISTLWTVDDAATGLLMEHFYTYTYLLDGKSKGDALRQAQLDVRNFGNGEYANPYYWAGFVLSGDGGEIEFSAETMVDDVVETEVPVSEMETAVPVATKPLNLGSNGLCAGAALPLAVMALVIGRRKKSHKWDQ